MTLGGAHARCLGGDEAQVLCGAGLRPQKSAKPGLALTPWFPGALTVCWAWGRQGLLRGVCMHLQSCWEDERALHVESRVEFKADVIHENS